MIAHESGLYVRIEEFPGPRALLPRPLESGFSPDVAYRVPGLFNPSRMPVSS